MTEQLLPMVRMHLGYWEKRKAAAVGFLERKERSVYAFFAAQCREELRRIERTLAARAALPTLRHGRFI